MKILIVDNTEDRREALCDFLRKLKLPTVEIICYENVWGNGLPPEPLRYLEPGDVNFVHANDEVNMYWDEFVEKICTNNYVVCFSGAGIGGLAWNNPKHLAFRETIATQHDISSKWFLKEFIQAIQSNEPKPFDKLIGYEPLLEAKLELLHRCLTPVGAREIDNDFPPELASYKAELYKISISEEDTKTAVRKLLEMKNGKEVTVEKLVRALSKVTATKNDVPICFSQEYQKLLTALRDVLLPEHESSN